MRSSSSWRKEVDDPTVDIFGNKKRGGGGDPVKNERGLIVPNASASARYQALRENLANKSSTSSINTSSINFGDGSSHSTTTKVREKTADELFREDLYKQIEEQKKAKYMAKLQEMEAERAEQERVKREIAALRAKHAAEMEHEQGDGAGFLRFSNSHSHIPPTSKPSMHSMAANVVPKVMLPPKPKEPVLASAMAPTSNIPTKLPTFGMSGESKESLKDLKPSPLSAFKQMETEKVSLSRLTELVQAMKPMTPHIPTPTTSTIPPPTTTSVGNRDSKSMELLQRQVIEQELELKRMRLQMLEQQNDQKTTLQYLLKLQTDFTEKLQQSNHQNAANIRRPLSGFTNITRAPPTPDIHPHSDLSLRELEMLRQIRKRSALHAINTVNTVDVHDPVHPKPVGISRVDSPLQSYDADHFARGTPGISRAISPPNALNALNADNIRASVISQSALNQIRQPISSYLSQQPVDCVKAVKQETSVPATPNVLKPSSYIASPGNAVIPRQSQVDLRSPPIQSTYIQNHQHLMQHNPATSVPQSRIPSQDSSPVRNPVQSQRNTDCNGFQQPQNGYHPAKYQNPQSQGTPSSSGRDHQSPPRNQRTQVSSRDTSRCATPQTFQVHSARPLQSQYTSPRRAQPQPSQEQKEESFILEDTTSDPQVTGRVVNELPNESSFLLCSDDEETESKMPKKHDDKMNVLNSSTQFELSSRPTTAIPADVIRQFGDRIASKPLDEDQRENGVRCSNNSNLSNLSYSLFQDPNEMDTEQDDPFAVHVVVEDSVHSVQSMQCRSPPMDCNQVNDSVLTVHEVTRIDTDNTDDDADMEQEPKVDALDDALKVNQEIIIKKGEDEWKQISEIDRDNVASLRDAFAELSKDDNDGNQQMSSLKTKEETQMTSETAATQKKEDFVVKQAECKEQDEESEMEYEEDFEEPEVEMGKGETGRAVFRLPELDSSINNFQSKVYSVYSSFDDTMMTNSVASSSDLSRGYETAQQQQIACNTICE